ncbi:LOW QUALITY PROTEIN: hypothetical protein HID58_090969, partial [Brassica napus]
TTTQLSGFFAFFYLISLRYLGSQNKNHVSHLLVSDQFDDTDPHERPKLWVGSRVLDPYCVMGLSLVSFFCGTPLYRFQKPGSSPGLPSSVAAYLKMSLKFDEEDHTLLFETQDKHSAILEAGRLSTQTVTRKYRVLTKPQLLQNMMSQMGSLLTHEAIVLRSLDSVTYVSHLGLRHRVQSAPVSDIHPLRAARTAHLRFLPLHSGWSTLQVCSYVSNLRQSPRSLVRRFTAEPKGFTDLQRMGVGLLVSVLSMAAAAIVETKRLRVLGAMNIFWQVPQYFLMGTAEVFFYIGQCLPLLSTAFGSYLSSLILSLVAYFTTMDGQDGWIPSEDIDKGHLDYFFWLLAPKLYAEDGSVDLHGNPPLKAKTGNWKACPFILGNECCERLAYYGIAGNLITYLTTKLHQGNVSAATNVTTWQGTCYLTPLIGAVLADAYWGRYWTIACFSGIYFIGMSALTLSASVPALKPAECIGTYCPSATPAQYAMFFSGLYLIALGTGGIKPCVSSFGADQFDDTDSRERVRKASFFNWFYFSINIGALVSSSLLVWIQENRGWGLGFGIPTVFMGLAIVSFFFGTPLYRFQKPGGSPITRISQVVVASFRKSTLKVPEDAALLYETQDKNSAIAGSRKIEHTDDCKYLDKAAVISDEESKSGDFSNSWRLCTVTQVEELKILIRMFPIWASGIIFSAVYAQMSTMFVQQGRAMDCKIGSFQLPPAALGTFDTASVIIWVPLYDRFIVPLARRFTGVDKGFTEIQRMGIGLFVSVLCMAAAAIIEIIRLRLADELGLVESGAPVPISVLWQIPQYFILGAAEVFYFIGQLEFFYDQSPDAMRSLCSALALLTNALGNYLSSLILTLVTYFTTRNGGEGWISDNLNTGHLDYFFWLLAGLSLVNMAVYFFSAAKYKQKKAS